tara:strand:- start:116 stop:523 length:408 start_codon:yes stop_codon:yes gene_type:complete
MSSEKRKQQMIENAKKNKEKKQVYDKEYRDKNKEKLKQQIKDWDEKPENKAKRKENNQTPKRRKYDAIRRWKGRGVICDDWDTLYERYLNTELCELCNCELTTGKRNKTTKCLDHCHETGEFRNILCLVCNTKRG